MAIEKKIIVAYDDNRAIGSDNKLLWHLPEDMRHFKQTTSGRAIIFGRKTLESIPGILTDRYVIAVSRNPEYNADCAIEHSLTDAYLRAERAGYNEVYIGGGEQIYRLALPDADVVIATEVHTVSEGADTYFPALDEEWFEVSREQHLGRSGLQFDFVRYERN